MELLVSVVAAQFATRLWHRGRFEADEEHRQPTCLRCIYYDERKNMRGPLTRILLPLTNHFVSFLCLQSVESFTTCHLTLPASTHFGFHLDGCSTLRGPRRLFNHEYPRARVIFLGGAQFAATVSTALPPPEPQCELKLTFTLATLPKHSMTNSTKKGSSATTTEYSVVPDKDRKRSNRLSATQKQFRRDKETYESRVLNLTLDINHLRQEVLYLINCRDLQVTRLLLEREERESNALRVADSILFGVEEGRDVPSLCPSSSMYNRCSFSGTLLGQTDSVPPMGVYEFKLLLDKSTCHHSYGVPATTQVLSFVEEDAGTDTDEAADIRWICGEPGGCVIESVGDLAGRLSREVLVSLFSPLDGDRMLMTRLVGLTITCSARLLLFFDSRHRLVRQIAQTNTYEVLNAVQQARPAEFATILDGNVRS